jgi:hypothetical protein
MTQASMIGQNILQLTDSIDHSSRLYLALSELLNSP